jgi:hypothetical protein
MKKYAILSNEGTACAETGICETCSSQRGVKNNIVKLAKTIKDISDMTFVDCSENENIECTNCGYGNTDNKWILTKEKLHNGIWFCVSDGEVGNRAISYDYRSRKEALKELNKLNNSN